MELISGDKMFMLPEGLMVAAAAESDLRTAEQLAVRLGLAVSDEFTDDNDDALILAVDGDRLSLRGDGMELCCDLTDMIRRLKPANLQHEMLIKAVRIKGVSPEQMTVVDATAGFGEDSLILAAAGFNMKLYEYDPVIAALLENGLERALGEMELSDAAGRMSLTAGDSIVAMKQLDFTPDVVLLDPMFPERQKSALVKKKFQLLHRLERPCTDEAALLEAAVAAGPRKIVIKRPVKGPYLAGVKPDHSLSGKAVRYDCIVMTPGRKLF